MSKSLAELPSMAINVDAVGGKAIETALSLGLFQSLQKGQKSSEQLSQDLEVSLRGLHPLLYLLCSMRLLTQQSELFSLSEQAPSFLQEEWSQVQKALPPAPDWEQLESAVRTGSCVRPAIEGQSDGGQFFSGIVELLYGLHSDLAQHLADELPTDLHRVLDLGAGSAVWSLGLASKRPEVRVVAVDQAKVLEEVTRDFVARCKLEEQYEFRPGSYHDVELESAYFDLVYLGHVIHSEGWEASRSLLKRCHATLKPGGLLAIAEWIGSEPRGEDYHANLFDLNMLMFTEKGLVFTASEMEALCREAGFLEPQWVKGPGRYPVLLTSKG